MITEALTNKFPVTGLNYILHQHAAPRVVQFKGSLSSRTLAMLKSILAGCRFSVAMTRALVMQSYTELIDKHRDVTLSVHVDDTPGYAEANTKEEVFKALTKFGESFAKVANTLKLPLSGKAGVVSSSFKFSKILVHRMNEYGITCTPYRVFRDLGVRFTTSYFRTQINRVRRSKRRKQHRSILKARMHKSQPRITRTKSLAQTFKIARKLYSGSGFSASTWGHQATGFTKSELIQIERQAADCTGVHPHGRCRFITLCVCCGPRGHPVARII